jgi:serine/threonine protein phosphatase PrpC
MFSKTSSGNITEKRTGKFISASIKGANHADKGLACQDTAASAILYYKGYKIYFMAVADGHGGAAYTLSDVGSFLALQAASESVNRFIMFVIDVYEKYPNNWVELVKEDFSGRFGKMLVSSWVRMVEAHANDVGNNADEKIKQYGTTISVAFVINNRLFSGKIGDSSVFALVNQNRVDEVKNLFEADENKNGNLGLETASLCSRDAYRKWQIQTLPLDDVQMLFLATDGFTDSLKDPEGEIMHFYHYIRKGLLSFERIIDEELKKITQEGVGDDISLVIFLPNYQGRVL